MGNVGTMAISDARAIIPCSASINLATWNFAQREFNEIRAKARAYVISLSRQINFYREVTYEGDAHCRD